MTDQSVAADASRAAVAEDCRIEGKALGMDGTDLETFIHDCLQDYFGMNLDVKKPGKSVRH